MDHLKISHGKNTFNKEVIMLRFLSCLNAHWTEESFPGNVWTFQNIALNATNSLYS